MQDWGLVVSHGLRYLKNLFLAVDQLLGAILGMDPDETISSFCGKLQRGGSPFLANIVDFFFGEGHCLRAIEEDEGKHGVIKP
jgi:hypothetical protein